jgi:hypothetical protein
METDKDPVPCNSKKQDKRRGASSRKEPKLKIGNRLAGRLIKYGQFAVTALKGYDSVKVGWKRALLDLLEIRSKHTPHGLEILKAERKAARKDRKALAIRKRIRKLQAELEKFSS